MDWYDRKNLSSSCLSQVQISDHHVKRGHPSKTGQKIGLAYIKTAMSHDLPYFYAPSQSPLKSVKVDQYILQTVQEHLSPFGRGITWAWVGILSSLGVFSERGRFEVFFEVSWIHLSWWEGSQNWTWKLKNRVFGFFCTPSKMPNPHQKSTQFLLFSNHWVEGWLKRHKWLGQLG